MPAPLLPALTLWCSSPRLLLAPVQSCTPRVSARDSERAVEDLQLLLQVRRGHHTDFVHAHSAAAAEQHQRLSDSLRDAICQLQAGELPGSRQRIARMLLHADSLGNEAFAGNWSCAVLGWLVNHDASSIASMPMRYRQLYCHRLLALTARLSLPCRSPAHTRLGL